MNERSKCIQSQISRFLDATEITTQFDDTTMYEDQTALIMYNKLFMEV